MDSNYSKLHQPITPEMLYTLVKNTFGANTQVKQYGLLQGGLFNTTYRIELDHPKYPDVILRLAPERVQDEGNEHTFADPLFSFERTMMASEPIIYELYRQQGIPCASVIACDSSGITIPRTYMFMHFIPSRQLNDPSLLAKEKEKLYRQLGAYTATMHTIEADTFGWPQADGTIKGSTRWSEVLLAYAAETATKAEQAHYLPGVGEEILSILEDNQHILDQVTKPVLVHNDLWEANVLIDEQQGQPRIAAIIDGDRSMFADREFEAILSTESIDFHEGYGRTLDMSEEGQLRRFMYRLVSAYFNAYVHEHQVNQHEDAQKYEQKTLSLLKEWKERN